MSGTARFFRKFVTEALPSAVQTDRHGVDGAIEHDRDLGVGQLFPVGELQDFRIRLPKAAERRPDLFGGLALVRGSFDLGGRQGWGGLVKPGQEPVPAGVAPIGVGQNLTGDREQPCQLVVVRYVADAAPRGQEDVSDDILRRSPVRAAAEGVGENAAPVTFEQQPIALLNVIDRGHACWF
ncbi:MAG: hypothetical protein QOF30_1667 [Acidimicrobiaceae bacterium]|nr:hypothetical protein [Acidimicrobiaceae bacterium]